MWLILVAVYVLSSFHAFIGTLSICTGIAATVNAQVWMAHRVSPIWSGCFFLINAIVGVLCARKRTAYLIMCFGAFSAVSMVTAVVSIQLLRLGLVNHTSDGDTFQKDDKDILVIMALATAGMEILVCMLSAVISCRVAHRARKEIHKKNEGTFSVEVLGDKDIVIHLTKPSGSYDKLSEQQTNSSNSIEHNPTDTNVMLPVNR